MAFLAHSHTSPPDGFRYVQPQTGGRYKADTLQELVELIVAHRAWKGLEPNDRPSVRKDIERQICAVMPPGVCIAEAGEDYRPLVDRARDISVDTLMEFSRAAFAFIKSGGELVSREESHRRAAICRGCPLNRPSPCVVCTPAYKMIDALIPKDRIEEGLSACGICGCSIRAIVLLPIKTLGHENLRFPEYCWQNAAQYSPQRPSVTSANP